MDQSRQLTKAECLHVREYKLKTHRAVECKHFVNFSEVKMFGGKERGHIHPNIVLGQ